MHIEFGYGRLALHVLLSLTHQMTKDGANLSNKTDCHIERNQQNQHDTRNDKDQRLCQKRESPFDLAQLSHNCLDWAMIGVAATNDFVDVHGRRLFCGLWFSAYFCCLDWRPDQHNNLIVSPDQSAPDGSLTEREFFVGRCIPFHRQSTLHLQ